MTMPLTGAGYSGNAPAGGYTFVNAEAEDYVAEFAVEPSDGWKEAIDDFIGELKSGSIYSITDYLRIGANVDSDAGTIDVIDPTRVATLVNSPTFTAKSGFAGNGTTSYVSEPYTPSTDAVHLSQNSAAIGVYIDAGTDAASNSIYAAGANDVTVTNGLAVNPRDASEDLRGRMNAPFSAFAGTVGTVLGLTVANRSASNATQGYRNGASVGTDNDTSTGLTSRNLYSGTVNNDGSVATLNTFRIGLVIIAASLDSTKQAALDTAWDNYIAAIAGL